MATRSPYKRHTKRSMIQSLPASSASRRFISRRRISMMVIPLAFFSGVVFIFFMPFNSWGQSSGSLDLSHLIHEVEVVAEFPHDPDAFTQVYVLPWIELSSHFRIWIWLNVWTLVSPPQGLLYAGNDTLFESTGLYGKVIGSPCIFLHFVIYSRSFLYSYICFCWQWETQVFDPFCVFICPYSHQWGKCLYEQER